MLWALIFMSVIHQCDSSIVLKHWSKCGLRNASSADDMTCRCKRGQTVHCFMDNAVFRYNYILINPNITVELNRDVWYVYKADNVGTGGSTLTSERHVTSNYKTVSVTTHPHEISRSTNEVSTSTKVSSDVHNKTGKNKKPTEYFTLYGNTTVTSSETQVTEEIKTSNSVIKGNQTTDVGRTTSSSLQTTDIGRTTSSSLQTTDIGRTTSSSLQTTDIGSTTSSSLQTTDIGRTTSSSLQTTDVSRTTSSSFQTTESSLSDSHKTTVKESKNEAARDSLKVHSNFLTKVQNSDNDDTKIYAICILKSWKFEMMINNKDKHVFMSLGRLPRGSKITSVYAIDPRQSFVYRGNDGGIYRFRLGSIRAIQLVKFKLIVNRIAFDMKLGTVLYTRRAVIQKYTFNSLDLQKNTEHEIKGFNEIFYFQEIDTVNQKLYYGFKDKPTIKAFTYSGVSEAEESFDGKIVYGPFSVHVLSPVTDSLVYCDGNKNYIFNFHLKLGTNTSLFKSPFDDQYCPQMYVYGEKIYVYYTTEHKASLLVYNFKGEQVDSIKMPTKPYALKVIFT